MVGSMDAQPWMTRYIPGGDARDSNAGGPTLVTSIIMTILLNYYHWHVFAAYDFIHCLYMLVVSYSTVGGGGFTGIT